MCLRGVVDLVDLHNNKRQTTSFPYCSSRGKDRDITSDRSAKPRHERTERMKKGSNHFPIKYIDLITQTLALPPLVVISSGFSLCYRHTGLHRIISVLPFMCKALFTLLLTNAQQYRLHHLKECLLYVIPPDNQVTRMRYNENLIIFY